MTLVLALAGWAPGSIVPEKIFREELNFTVLMRQLSAGYKEHAAELYLRHRGGALD